MTSGGNRNPANPETGGWMDRMRRRRFTPTASFTHGRGTNPNGSRQVRAQCNSAFPAQVGPNATVPRIRRAQGPRLRRQVDGRVGTLAASAHSGAHWPWRSGPVGAFAALHGDNVVTSRLLDRVHGRVGQSEDLIRMATGFPNDGDPDADGHVEILSVHPHRLCDDGVQALGYRLGRIQRIGQISENSDEFVTSETGDDILGTHLGGQT